MTLFQQLQKLKIGDVVEVTWLDHSANAGWNDRRDILGQSPFLIVSVGYFAGVSKDKQQVLLAGTTPAEDARVSSTQLVLLKVTTKIERIKR